MKKETNRTLLGSRVHINMQYKTVVLLQQKNKSNTSNHKTFVI